MAALPDDTSEFQRWADPVGGTGAMLCALHCAALPFVLVALPSLSLGFFATSAFEQAFAVFATVIGVSSLWSGYRLHRVPLPFVVLACGLVSVWTGVTVATVHDNVVAHAVAMATGGVLIAIAHLLNLRQGHAHRHDANCAHRH